ncbi:hypothetical protein L7F22_063949 [Adiantum nelumboides]|nr:hypothetical protein [Adiantum nelumboides]
MAKPGRSEEVDMDAEQQARAAEAIREKFAAEATRRALKPSRSDDFSSDAALAAAASFDGPIPEHLKLQQLLQTSPAQTGSGFIQVPTKQIVDLSSLPDAPIVVTEVSTSKHRVGSPEEFVETEYYKGLNAVDKASHHTTGSGFIQVEKNGAFAIDFSSPGLVRTKSGCNPATNDWIPSETAVEMLLSEKPRRSEG